jgi:hypothetical protein
MMNTFSFDLQFSFLYITCSVDSKFLAYPLQFIIVHVLWQILFSMILRQPGEDNLERFYETFHGANISVQVTIFLEKNLLICLCVERTIGIGSHFPPF